GESIGDFLSDLPEQTEIKGHSINWVNDYEPRPESIRIWWGWAGNSDGHILERKAPNDENEGFQQIMREEKGEWTDTGDKLRDGELISGETYIYRVCGYNDNGEGDWSEEYTVVVPSEP
ncbi:MAG TPA: hypothetical protein DCO79_07165, partial [Spirochaeta sp.]|nr:hypothetical protein [Spirochaeta sp.]